MRFKEKAQVGVLHVAWITALALTALELRGTGTIAEAIAPATLGVVGVILAVLTFERQQHLNAIMGALADIRKRVGHEGKLLSTRAEFYDSMAATIRLASAHIRIVNATIHTTHQREADAYARYLQAIREAASRNVPVHRLNYLGTAADLK